MLELAFGEDSSGCKQETSALSTIVAQLAAISVVVVVVSFF